MKITDAIILDKKLFEEQFSKLKSLYKGNGQVHNCLKVLERTILSHSKPLEPVVSDACDTHFRLEEQEMCGMVRYEDLKQQYLNKEI